MASIRRLNEDVVNRIAAGEVIHRPASAIKELIENSLDAGATSISIRANAGGVKGLTIQDNGRGIREKDLTIVCERFTTSKLQKFDELKEIGTYGFRGEALASISHVAKVTITSKTSDTPCAFKAKYIDGKLAGGEKPKPCAGVAGTTIAVEDLFYNMTTRKRAVKSSGEEYSRILDVVSKYAVHRGLSEEDKEANERPKASPSESNRMVHGTGMICKKTNNPTPDVHTSSTDSKIDNIRSIYGSSVANELIRLSPERFEFNKAECRVNLDENEEETSRDGGEDEFVGALLQESKGWSVEGYVTNANYNRKKGTLIFFINERLVEIPTLKRALDALYAEYLPKGTHPFAYLAITMPPKHVDVNVSPNKREVHFLFEDAIVNQIIKALRSKLVGANSSRVFYTQQTIIPIESDSSQRESSQEITRQDEPAAAAATTTTSTAAPAKQAKLTNAGFAKAPGTATVTGKRKYEPNKLVRIDSKARKLDEFFVVESKSTQAATLAPVQESSSSSSLPKRVSNNSGGNATTSPERKLKVPKNAISLPADTFDDKVSEEARDLTSVQDLIDSFEKRKSEKLHELLKDVVFVGWVDSNFCLVQIHTGLYVLDFVELFRELFYQQTLRNFGAFKRIVLETPLDVEQVLLVGMRAREKAKENGLTMAQMQKKASEHANFLCKRHAMLDEYFRINIDPEKRILQTLPEIISGYRPFVPGIAPFLLRICERVDWWSEKGCFDSMSAELAEFYVQFPPFDTTQNNDSWSTDEKDPRFMIRNTLFPHLRKSFIPYHEHFDTSRAFVRQVAALEVLYKIFERC